MRRVMKLAQILVGLMVSLVIGLHAGHLKVKAELYPTINTPEVPLQSAYGITIAQNGDFVFVAAPSTSLNFTGGVLTGAVYVYKKDHNKWHNTQIITRTELVNVQELVVNYTGLFQVESQQDWLFLSNIGPTASSKGSVLIYRLNKETSKWEPVQILDATTPGLTDLSATNPDTGETGALFGLYFSADVPHGHLLVGAQTQQNVSNGQALINSGAAYLFKLDEKTQQWRLKQKFVNPTGMAADDFFGAKVALHGDLALVSNGPVTLTQKTGESFVYVFQHKKNHWVYTQRLHASTIEAKSGNFGVGAERSLGSGFGGSLAMNTRWAIVGAPFETQAGGASSSGAVYFYQIDTNSHGVKTLRLRQKFFSRSPSSALTGVYHFALHDDVVLVPDPARAGPTGNPHQGGIIVLQYNGHRWVPKKTIYDPHGVANDFFGAGVSLSQEYIIGGNDTLFFPLFFANLITPAVPDGTLPGGKVLIFQR